MPQKSPLPWAALAVVIALGLPAKVCADLLITEFLADNSNGLADEDLQFSDWIEIHNNGPDPADLGGLFLTDDPALPARWEIPSFVLGAGEYTVIFASGKDRVGTELHTNFRLNRDGEYLALVDADGTTVLHEYAPMFPPQDNDRSFGLVEPVAGAPQAAFGSPTPGAANDVSSAPGERVGFSPTSRAFSGSIQVSLTANSPTAQIRYTTNGTAPTASSALYASPITLNSSTRLRAQIFEPGRPPGPVASETYISADAGAMNATSNLPIVLLENFGGGKPNADTEAMIMIFDRDPDTGLASMSGEPQMATRCRIRVRGSSTAGEAKYSMVWEAWDEFNADKDVTPLGMPEESDWILSGRYHWDQTLIHNEFMYSLSNQIGRYASRTRFVELYFNTGGGTFSSGDYFGVYSIQEKIKRDGDRVDVGRLPDDDDTLPAISGGYVTKIDRADPGDVGFPAAAQTIRWVYPKEQEVTTAQRNYLQGYFNDFYAALQSPNFYEPDTGYEKYIDVDSWIDHHILNTIPKNLDAFRLSGYHHKERGGKIAMGPAWDFDRSMDSTDGRDDNFNVWRGQTGDEGTDFFRYTWWDRLFEDKNFWQRWLDRYTALRQSELSNANVHATIDGMAAEIGPAAARNFARWTGYPPRNSGSNHIPGNTALNGTWDGEIQYMKDWLQARMEWMDDQFLRQPTFSAPGGNVPGGYQLVIDSASLSEDPTRRIYYTLDGTDPRPFARDFLPEITATFVGDTTQVRALVPTSDIGTSWQGGSEPYNDSAWTAGQNGVGYENSSGYESYIHINLHSQMYNARTTAYIRIPFTVNPGDLDDVDFLTLGMRRDDGFVAFLNGTQVAASSNAPASLNYLSAASADNPDGNAIGFEEFDLSAHLNLLAEGENILAIHGLNRNTTSSDFLIEARLTAGRDPDPIVEVQPNAIEYTGPVTLAGPANVFARAYDPGGSYDPFPYVPASQKPVGTPWSAPLQAIFYPGATDPAAANLAITEIMYHPAEPGPSEAAAGFGDQGRFEYLNITNIGGSPINLTGARFTSGIDYAFPAGQINALDPGQTLVLCKDAAAFAHRYGAGVTPHGEFGGNLNNSGETITLVDAGNTTILTFTYSDNAPWPAEADGPGYALVLIDPAGSPDYNDAASWRASLDIGGTPGGVALNSYADFANAYFDEGEEGMPALADPNADADGDGWSNGAEFALGTNPRDPLSVPNVTPLPPTEAGEWSIRFRRRIAGDFTIQPVAASNLAGPWDGELSPAGSAPNGDGTATETYSGTAGDAGFARLEIVLPQ